MNYIYDILVNFQKELYDIYDWNIDDNIMHVKKMPLFKVKKSFMLNVLKNNIKVSEAFLSKTYNKTEMFFNKKIITIDYACIISDGEEALVLNFNKKGKIINKSKLLIDESEDVTDCALSLVVQNIEYEIINCLKQNNFRTRKEKDIYRYIVHELNKAIKNEEKSKLQYLYFECFGSLEKDNNKIIMDIKRYLEDDWNGYYVKIYDFFKLTISK